MNLNQLKPTYWTDQQTGEQIGPMYSWNDIREIQLNECMAGMRDSSYKENSKGSVRNAPRIHE